MQQLDYVVLTMLLCGIAVFSLTVIKVLLLSKSQKPKAIGLFSIWLIGLIGFILSFVAQTINMIQTFDMLGQAGEIAQSLIKEEIDHSFEITLWGLYLLIFSLIFWGIAKVYKNHRIQGVSNEQKLKA